MTLRRPILLYTGETFFDPALPVYVNRVAENYELTEHRHDFLEISFVGEGAGTHHIGEEGFPVAQGDIFFLPVGVSHVFRPSAAAPKHPLIVYNCVIAPEAALRLVGAVPGGAVLRPLLESQQYRRFRDSNGDFHWMFQRLHDEYQTDRPGREAALYQGVLGLLLYLFRMDSRSDASGAAVLVPDGVEAVIAAVHGRFEQELPAKQMAAIAGVGERQLHRMFKKHAGMPLKAYHQNVRIREACRLLRDTDRKISDIASAVGYQDITYFNELFKRKNGVSPREYRSRAES
ncbi:AraC family transcriptional regulator [Paenibacillus sacheonensis]|uniref:Helix-turn-helix domain-containing protein n=1 Tax=Paenibacillus sacheonensis TaxID=742054 RepID=A0A7X4YU23_9BACL|nr:AraC family transcriptional regulator [Paenibacillus sacheonensis]MBM7568863.1 AraC family L-rhamnose operon transcriptional activator RhaR [Paenibacillus sacheonensis]NBC72566.1 helix-turn-helix domain-containing protein [Paenibacillus sacheonensis]